jgi:IrrE N-terminal-like domain
VGENFGIGYSTAISNKGFENFTVGHELGHYFLDGHAEAIFANGAKEHLSRSGFVSDDKYEREADAFAAELLMPETLFKDALRKCGAGFAGIQYLAELGETSLVATAIRFCKVTGDPVAVILSSGSTIDWCFVSKELAQCRDVFPLRKGSALPANGATARFNRDSARIGLSGRPISNFRRMSSAWGIMERRLPSSLRRRLCATKMKTRTKRMTTPEAECRLHAGGTMIVHAGITSNRLR